jgi:hypothetical protein
MTPMPRHLLLLLFVGLFAAGSVCAAPPERRVRQDSSDDANARSEAQGKSNLPESVRRVERQTGGEVLRAEPMQRDGREVYRVKVLTSDGRVRVIQDDPQSQGRSDRQDRSDDPPRGAARVRPRSDESSDNDQPA